MKKSTNITSYIKSLTIYFVIILTIISRAFSQSAYNILDQSSTARDIALSGGGTSILSQVSCTNIASINIGKLCLGSSILFYPADIMGNSVYLFHKTKSGIIGGEIFSLNYGILEDGETNITFSAKDILLKGHYKTTIWNSIALGISVNYLSSKIENYKSDLVSADFGLRTSVINRQLMISLAAQNLGIVTKSYEQTVEQPPKRFVIGLSYKPSHFPGVLSVDFQKYNGDEYHYIGAIEFNPDGNFKIRLSTGDHRWDLTTGNFWEDISTGIAVGSGLTVSSTTVDVGFQNIGSAGFVTAISIQFDY